MNPNIVDVLLTAPRRARARRRGGDIAGVRYIESPGARLRVLDSGGDKPVVLLTPDGPCVIEHFVDLCNQLAGRFRVICFDMPGFGFSFPYRGYRHGIAETADIVVALMDTLSAPTAVVAFSCAQGFVAMNLAKRYPERVTHLVLAQTPSARQMGAWADRNVPGLLRKPFIGQFLGALASAKLAHRWFDLALPRDSDFKASFRQTSLDAIDRGACFGLAGLAQGCADLPDEDFLGVQCPTLLIHGDRDHSHRETDFQSIKDLVPAADVETFAGCGHFPNLERRTEYAERLVEFARS